MIHFVILGIKTITADILIPNWNAAEKSYPANAPTIAPRIPPITIGSANTPTFSCKLSIEKSILFNPGIFSIIASIANANGAIHVPVP